MDPWAAIACVSASSVHTMLYLAHGLAPLRGVHLGKPGQGSSTTCLIPAGEFFQTVPSSWVRACTVCRRYKRRDATQRSVSVSVCTMRGLSPCLWADCVCKSGVPWNGRRDGWGSPLTGSSCRQYGQLIHDTSLSARLIRYRTNPVAAERLARAPSPSQNPHAGAVWVLCECPMPNAHAHCRCVAFMPSSRTCCSYRSRVPACPLCTCTCVSECVWAGMCVLPPEKATAFTLEQQHLHDLAALSRLSNIGQALIPSSVDCIAK